MAHGGAYGRRNKIAKKQLACSFSLVRFIPIVNITQQMSDSLGTFQSAVQLVSGANLAIFALPKLGQEKLEMEARRWSAAVEAVRVRPAGPLSTDHIQVAAEYAEFRKKWDALTAGSAAVRQLALLISVVAASYLVWMSAYPDDPPNLFIGILITAGAVPGLVLVGRDDDARKLIREFSAKRALI